MALTLAQNHLLQRQSYFFEVSSVLGIGFHVLCFPIPGSGEDPRAPPFSVPFSVDLSTGPRALGFPHMCCTFRATQRSPD